MPDFTTEAVYAFTEWTGSAVDAGKISQVDVAKTTILMDQDYDLVANFELEQHQVTIQSSTGGSTDRDGVHMITHGESITIVPSADTGYSFTGWSGDIVGSENPLTLTIVSDIDLTAEFSRRPVLTIDSSEGGSVIRPGEGVFTYDQGEQVVIEAQPDEGYYFRNWSGVDDSLSLLNPLTLTMVNDISITAVYSSVPRYCLKVYSMAGGTIALPNEMLSIHDEGSEVGIAVQEVDPNCFLFLGWNGSAVENGDVLNPDALSTTVIINGETEVEACFQSLLDELYVDDDALNDPGPENLTVSDPLENGTELHPLDSIQEAIVVAGDGSKTLVYSGIYRETLDSLGKNFDLRSLNLDSMESYPVIDANQAGVVVTFKAGEDSNSTSEDPNCSLQGLVLTGGFGDFAGAIYCENMSPLISHCLITGNRCNDSNESDPNGGVIYCRDSNAVLEHCTISGNQGGAEGAACQFIDSNAVIINSIVWGNNPTQIVTDQGNAPLVWYSNVEGGYTGTGNQHVDPCFVTVGYWNEPNMKWTEGDYHLRSEAGRWDSSKWDWVYDAVTSVCIDAGDPNTIIDPNFDDNEANLGAYGGTPQASRSQTRFIEMEFISINDQGGFNGQMSKYETTNAQYCQYLNEALANGDIMVSNHCVYAIEDANHSQKYLSTHEVRNASQIAYSDGSFSVCNRDGYSMVNHPVVEVTWYGAKAFCDHYDYRLPTESEWQAVADYLGDYTYGCGTSINEERANYSNANPLGLPCSCIKTESFPASAAVYSGILTYLRYFDHRI